MSLLNLTRVLAGNGIAFDVRTVTDSLITRARNHIANEFLREDGFTHLLFIEADLGFDANAVLRYLAFAKDLVCGVYPLKRLDIAGLRASTAATDAAAEAASYLYSSTISIGDDNQPENGFLRTDYGATGFMLIARGVLTRLREAYPDLRYGGDHSVWTGGADRNAAYAFFDTMIAEGKSLPEDYAFCKRWRDIGGGNWVVSGD